MLYLASPYTGTLEEMQQRYDAVLHVTATLLVNKQWVFSPIIHCHDMAVRYKLPRDIDFWYAYNEAMLLDAERLYILTLPGWISSRGIQHEMAFAEKLNKPSFLVSMLDTKIVVSNIDGEPVREFTLIS